MDHEFSVLKRYKRVTLILNVVLHPNKSNLNPQTSLLQAEGLSPLSFSALWATETNNFPNMSSLNCYIEFWKKNSEKKFLLENCFCPQYDSPSFLVACSDSIRHRVGPSVGRSVGRSVGNTFTFMPFWPLISLPKSLLELYTSFHKSFKKYSEKKFWKKKFWKKILSLQPIWLITSTLTSLLEA